VFLVVGLGNPGREYEATRHNVGFMVVDALRAAEGWSDFKAKFSGVWTRGELGAERVALLKPQTYMNLSGESVQPAAAFLKVPAQNVIVVHDELDLAWRDVRLKLGGGYAGHNGLRSVAQRLGPGFVRVRIGIGKPPGRSAGADYVLKRPARAEREALDVAVQEAADAVEVIVAQGPEAAMARFNGEGGA
jgi:PTH1 family peptidyl-tRNA hydrolase